MIEVRQTEAFSRWLRRLKDAKAKARIAARIERMRLGNLGDWKSRGRGLMEIRVDYGPGYRVYFVHRDTAAVICSAAATSAHSGGTSGKLTRWRRNYDENIPL